MKRNLFDAMKRVELAVKTSKPFIQLDDALLMYKEILKMLQVRDKHPL